MAAAPAGLAVLAVGAALSGCGGPSAQTAPADVDGCRGSQLEPDPSALQAMHAATLCLLNAERTRHGLVTLLEDPSLQAAAESHSRDMARRDYFEHDTPEGIQPWMRITQAGYRAPLVGENLAWGEADMGTPAHAMKLWMHSRGHRENLLDPRYTQVGIGLAFGSPDRAPSRLPGAIYTTTFGSAAVTTR